MLMSSPVPTALNLDALHTFLSKFSLSYTNAGIHMKANITSASEFRTLLDAFDQLTVQPGSDNDDGLVIPTSPTKRNSVVLYRNKSCKSVPINVLQAAGLLGLERVKSNHHGGMTLRQIADLCVNTYFSCWVRCLPVLDRQEFMAWYFTQSSPEDSLIVNAICCLAFRQVVSHHCPPGLQAFVHDPDMVHDQEEFFFQRTRNALAQSFDEPDRYTVAALAFLCARAAPSRRQHYGGLAVSLLQQLAIYPRMKLPQRRPSSASTLSSSPSSNSSCDQYHHHHHHQDNTQDDYTLEMDTRLWWFIWQIDFALWTAGLPKLTPLLRRPNDRYDQVDLPMVHPQDPLDMHVPVLAQHHTLILWHIQVDLTSLYEQDAELTSEQLSDFDDRLDEFYQALPEGLKFDAHNKPKTPDQELASVRIQLEYNATRIILHRLFMPDVGDSQPNGSALASLNICLQVALHQLHVLQLCVSPPLDCAYDRDEVGRVARLLSTALDVYRTIKDPEQYLLPGIDAAATLENGLEQCLTILKSTSDGSCIMASVDLAQFVHLELQRHRLHTTRSTPQSFHTPLISSPSSLPPSAKETPVSFTHHHARPRVDHPLRISKPTPSSTLSEITPMTLQQQRGKQPLTGLSSPAPSIISFASPSTPSTMASSSGGQRKSSGGKPSKPAVPRPTQFSQQTFVQATGIRIDGKDQPRFRYFNPRKMNKFLFIDENQ
ncbi:hypothetical protein DM01DRAFT_1338439 [Hesseltinella vesiculosa]|uniref:Xylanolytic transcriptional activator regulatory domain-containing protein n=1 Tax=Hesseltinella vesiculosa TaxID=101127 RepID=A0A1X2G9W7_9FUNG|nr:hypothetical protein DM01DRAFT_1338439 [Hesseltinella vesiculosa]